MSGGFSWHHSQQRDVSSSMLLTALGLSGSARPRRTPAQYFCFGCVQLLPWMQGAQWSGRCRAERRGTQHEQRRNDEAKQRVVEQRWRFPSRSRPATDRAARRHHGSVQRGRDERRGPRSGRRGGQKYRKRSVEWHGKEGGWGAADEPTRVAARSSSSSDRMCGSGADVAQSRCGAVAVDLPRGFGMRRVVMMEGMRRLRRSPDRHAARGAGRRRARGRARRRHGDVSGARLAARQAKGDGRIEWREVRYGNRGDRGMSVLEGRAMKYDARHASGLASGAR